MLLCFVFFFLSTKVYGAYNLITTYAGDNFFNQFNFQTSNAGYSQFFNSSESEKRGLIKVNNNQAYIGVDTTTVIEPGYPGRPSVYLRSKVLYNEGLFISSIDHMPQGCGIQPQFWMEGVHWPSNGEIMMLTCTNTENITSASIQGNKPCNFANTTDNFNFTGNMIQTNCGGSGYGCPIIDDNTNSCTIQFNANKGAYHAMQWVNSNNNGGGVKVWFWNKNQNNIPSDITSNSKTPDPGTFGEPFAAWKFGSWCDDGLVFNQTLTIDLQFCGYSSSTFEKDGCANITGTTNCEGWVANNPNQFKDTYWLFDYINVYQQE